MRASCGCLEITMREQMAGVCSESGRDLCVQNAYWIDCVFWGLSTPFGKSPFLGVGRGLISGEEGDVLVELGVPSRKLKMNLWKE